MKKDNLSGVIKFLKDNDFRLPNKDLPNWRLVPEGTYTHKTLPYGAMRVGITNGIIAYMCSVVKRQKRDRDLHMTISVDMPMVVEVHLANMSVILDKPQVRYKAKAKSDKPKKVKKPLYNDEDLT